MTRLLIGCAVALLAQFAGFTRGLAADAQPDRRPNLVMIFTDDQRWDAVGYTGNAAVHTPNLDRLARGGLVFRNCFVATSICAINRANLLSGQYPGRKNLASGRKPHRQP